MLKDSVVPPFSVNSSVEEYPFGLFLVLKSYFGLTTFWSFSHFDLFERQSAMMRKLADLC